MFIHSSKWVEKWGHGLMVNSSISSIHQYSNSCHVCVGGLMNGLMASKAQRCGSKWLCCVVWMLVLQKQAQIWICTSSTIWKGEKKGGRKKKGREPFKKNKIKKNAIPCMHKCYYCYFYFWIFILQVLKNVSNIYIYIYVMSGWPLLHLVKVGHLVFGRKTFWQFLVWVWQGVGGFRYHCFFFSYYCWCCFWLLRWNPNDISWLEERKATKILYSWEIMRFLWF